MEIKRTINNIRLAAAALAVLLAACTDEPDTTASQTWQHSEAVCFATDGTAAAAEPATRHAGYVDETVEEWPVEECGLSPTRGAIGSSLAADFNPAGMRIFLYDGDFATAAAAQSIQVPETRVGLLPVMPTLGALPSMPCSFSADNVLSPLRPTGADPAFAPYTILWSSTPALYAAVHGGTAGNFQKMRTYAMAPLTVINELCHDGTGTDGLQGASMQFISGGFKDNQNTLTGAAYTASAPPSVIFTVPDEPARQKDLIAAYSGEMNMDDVYGMKVPLTFYHVFTAVQFKVGFACRVKRLTIDGVYKKGHVDIVQDGHDEWNFRDYTNAGTYTYTWRFNGTTGTDHAAGDQLTAGDQTLMMIPQTIPDGAKVILAYEPTGGGAEKTVTCDISSFTWLAGHRYVYTIKETPTFDVYFDLAAGQVDINGSAYQGYVFVDGVATAVSGTHNTAANRYYIYQSTGEAAGDYDKHHTGYTAATWNAGAPAAAPVIPAYPMVMFPGSSKTWADYMTGNKNVRDAFNNWAAAATAAGRTPTTNRIHISAAANVTIDNLWGTNEDYFTNNTFDAQGEVAAPYRFFVSTVSLKGDNKLTKFTTSPDGYTTVTSYYGNGSSKGSLTVTKNTDTPFSFCGHTVMGSRNQQNTYIQIDGGTVYVGMNTRNHNEDANLSDNTSKSNACLSGGNNHPGWVVINGGRVTAVAYGNSAAIGGGAGGDSNAGEGTVTINGGEVYAYQFCMRTSAYGVASIRSTAIGGGSCWRNIAAKGTVTINGGYVYAESVGGVAIGGGTSTGSTGGDAVVTITGGTVIARSVAGTVYGKELSLDVPAITSIGGGGGGNWANAYSTAISGRLYPHGGNATVRISGGTVRTGTIGGGTAGICSEVAVRRGYATVEITGGDVQGQSLMQKGGSAAPSFRMTDGTLHLGTGAMSYQASTNQLLLETADYGTFYFMEPNGGAVWMDDGNVSISGGQISGFTALNGGAVYMEGGTFQMTGGQISSCQAKYNSVAAKGGNGGAVYINDATGSASVNVSGTARIHGNVADWNGGGVYLNGGIVNVSGGTIELNRALDRTGVDTKGCGGGIYLMKGNFTMDGAATLVQGNTANRNGGGIFVSSESTDILVNILNGSIRDNVCERYGAGLYVVPGAGRSATVNIGQDNTTYNNEYPAITGNSASLNGGGIYASGANASLNIYDGKIKDNTVAAYVTNQDVTNEGGSVQLGLNAGGLPTPDLNYITVTIDPAGGDFADGTTEGTPVTRYLVTSSNSALQIPQARRRNFNFVKWLPSQGQSDTGHPDSYYPNGGSVTFNYDKNLTLTAQWVAQ